MQLFGLYKLISAARMAPAIQHREYQRAVLCSRARQLICIIFTRNLEIAKDAFNPYKLL